LFRNGSANDAGEDVRASDAIRPGKYYIIIMNEEET
jgi:hypothetical protein